MKFYSLTDHNHTEDFSSDYKTAREIGFIRLSDTQFYFKSKMKVYYIPYTDIYRCFRRVMSVPMSFCCGKGDMAVENLVICDKDDQELAQIQLPGTKAAKILMEELKEKIPHAKFGKPE